ncbi:uncharacterized protein LOC127564140 [Antechinus flavipes]|uniref:uncharacterized protein LOC127564140 n=1 Tax=Antechinus flavipes TaxID=38775 RepID=UPI0022360A4E|nr:uncharacterized protein LOC127564140 [Antechinus flavipes]
MAQRNGVFPQDLVQEQPKSRFEKTKRMIFRGPPHRIAPAAKNNMQQLDLKGQEDSIPAKPKVEAKDIGDPSWVRTLPSTVANNTLASPSIMMEPFPPISLKSHPKATLACPGQGVNAASKGTSKIHSTGATECQTSSKTGLELSSLWSQGEAFATQGATPVYAVKSFNNRWKRTTKISPPLLPESKTAFRDLSEASFNWAQGDASAAQDASPVSDVKGVSAPWKRKPKISPAMTNGSKTSQKVVSETTSNCPQGKRSSLQEALRVCGMRGVYAPRKKKTNVYPTVPIRSKTSPKVVSETSNGPQTEAYASQEATPYPGIKVVITGIKRSTKASPGLPSEPERSPEIIFESSYNWLQEECAGTQKATTLCPPEASGRWKTTAKVQRPSFPQSEPLPRMVTDNSSPRPQEEDCEQQSAFRAFIENLHLSGFKEAYRALLISPRKRNQFVTEKE